MPYGSECRKQRACSGLNKKFSHQKEGNAASIQGAKEYGRDGDTVFAATKNSASDDEPAAQRYEQQVFSSTSPPSP